MSNGSMALKEETQGEPRIVCSLHTRDFICPPQVHALVFICDDLIFIMAQVGNREGHVPQYHKSVLTQEKPQED